MQQQLPDLLRMAFGYRPMEVFDASPLRMEMSNANPTDGDRDVPLSGMSERLGVYRPVRVADCDNDGNGDCPCGYPGEFSTTCLGHRDDCPY